MISSIKTSLARTCSQISKIFRSSSPLASAQSSTSYPIAEEPDCYVPGGFHPISLGDTFQSDRYTVLRKLGYGQYSTVWLAKDARHKKFVALKMLRADCYGGSHDIFEIDILTKIREVSRTSSHDGRNYISQLLEQFRHTGPNGQHVCLVFDVLGYHMDYQAAKHVEGRLPLKAMKVITRQLLLGLDFLHTECGVIHTDLKPTNILLELGDIEANVAGYLSTVPARTDPENRTTAPLREVIPTPLLSETDDVHVRIIDFGVASWRKTRLSDRIQSPALRAPEVTIGAPWDTGVDIWSLGCLVIEFVQGTILFTGEASKKGTWTAEDDHLAKIIEALGPFPLDFIKRGTRAKDFFDAEGKLRRIPDLNSTSLERLVNGTSKPFLKPNDMPEAEIPLYVDFLRGMLTVDPAS
ncbi:protein kinase [Aspergillus crustosus]